MSGSSWKGCGLRIGDGGATTLANVRLVPILGTEPEGPVTIRFRGDTIVAVEPMDRSDLTNATQVVDGAGRYVMPGLVDPHVHVREVGELKLYLAAGVTSVRNMNGRFGSALAWRDSIAHGSLLGPRFVTSSPTLFDGAPDYEYHVDGPETARAMARRFSSEGYDLIKVYRLAESSMVALTEEASRLQIPVAGHIPLPEADLSRVLQLGLVSLEHLNELVGPAFGGRPDYDRIPEVASRLAAADVMVGTILSQWRGINRALEDPDWLLRDSLVERATFYFGPDGSERLRDMAEDMRQRTEDERARDRSDFDFLFALLRALDEHGVAILASTDAHQALAPAGEALWNELAIMLEAGLPVASALRTVTINPARLMEEEGRAGSVEVGKRADLVVLDASPLQDLATLRRPWAVVTRGRWLDRERLDRLLAEGRAGR